MAISRCIQCGQLSCTCHKFPYVLGYEDIAHVVSHLRGTEAGFATELNLRRLLRNLADVTRITAMEKLARNDTARRLPTYGATTLLPLLTLLLDGIDDAAFSLRCARELPSPQLAAALRDRNIFWIREFLYIYNARFHPISQPILVDMEAQLELDRQVFRYTEMRTCDIISRIIPIIYDADPRINKWAYTKPKIDQASGRPYVSGIWLGACIPRPALKMIICHELVHLALWLNGLNIPNGANEEIFCNAVMSQYADVLEESADGEELQIIQYRRGLCERAAHNKDEMLYRKISELLKTQQKNEALTCIIQA